MVVGLVGDTEEETGRAKCVEGECECCFEVEERAFDIFGF
jgi:hypothetical protein